MEKRRAYDPNAPGRREKTWAEFLERWKLEADKAGYRPHSSCVSAVLQLSVDRGTFTITLEDFAGVHGSSRSTASRELRKMVESGLLRKQDRKSGRAMFTLVTALGGDFNCWMTYWNLTYRSE